jgi:hypothetical protein
MDIFQLTETNGARLLLKGVPLVLYNDRMSMADLRRQHFVSQY